MIPLSFEAPVERLLATSRALADTLRTAEALVRSERQIDLDGLERQVGALCEAMLAAQPRRSAADAARSGLWALRTSLAALLASTDSLIHAVSGAGSR